MSRSKLTPYAAGRLVGAVAAGATVADACRLAGLAEPTVRGWIARGRREPGTPYADLVLGLDAAATEPLTIDDVHRLLGLAARNGSVRAQALLLRELRRKQGQPKPTLSAIDELAQRRHAGSAS